MSPFVLIADMESDVMVVTTVVVIISSIACPANQATLYRRTHSRAGGLASDEA